MKTSISKSNFQVTGQPYPPALSLSRERERLWRIYPRRVAGDSTAGAGRQGQATASGGAFRPLDSPPPTVLFYPRRRGIYHHRALLYRGPAPWDKVSRSKAPLLFQSVLFLRLCQFGRLFLFPVVQQGHNLFFHFGRSDLLAKILCQLRC